MVLAIDNISSLTKLQLWLKSFKNFIALIKCIQVSNSKLNFTACQLTHKNKKATRCVIYVCVHLERTHRSLYACVRLHYMRVCVSRSHCNVQLHRIVVDDDGIIFFSCNYETDFTCLQITVQFAH